MSPPPPPPASPSLTATATPYFSLPPNNRPHSHPENATATTTLSHLTQQPPPIGPLSLSSQKEDPATLSAALSVTPSLSPRKGRHRLPLPSPFPATASLSHSQPTPPSRSGHLRPLPLSHIKSNKLPPPPSSSPTAKLLPQPLYLLAQPTAKASPLPPYGSSALSLYSSITFFLFPPSKRPTALRPFFLPQKQPSPSPSPPPSKTAATIPSLSSPKTPLPTSLSLLTAVSLSYSPKTSSSALFSSPSGSAQQP